MTPRSYHWPLAALLALAMVSGARSQESPQPGPCALSAQPGATKYFPSTREFVSIFDLQCSSGTSTACHGLILGWLQAYDDETKVWYTVQTFCEPTSWSCGWSGLVGANLDTDSYPLGTLLWYTSALAVGNCANVTIIAMQSATGTR